MLSSFRAKTDCELEAKAIQERILYDEKLLGELCNAFAHYSRKAARLRDKTDDLSKCLKNGSQNEDQSVFEELADRLTVLGDYGDARVKLMDNKVVHELGKYEDICKHVKDEVKDIFSAKDKEFFRKRQLDRIKDRNPRNRQQIIQAETEFIKASAEVSKTVHNLEEKMNNFERQKIHDLKSILLDFITVEMGFHAKALEVLTESYKLVENIDEDMDLEQFRNKLRLKESGTNKRFFRSSQSMGSLGGLFTGKKGFETQTHSKSEETLDSIKHEISDSEQSSTETDEETQSHDTLNSSDQRLSPIIVQRFNK